MDISHIEHIGIAVPSLEEAIPFYENILGLKCFAIEEVADQKVKTAFFKVGQTKIELLEGTSPESAISKFIANNGGRGGILGTFLSVILIIILKTGLIVANITSDQQTFVMGLILLLSIIVPNIMEALKKRKDK